MKPDMNKVVVLLLYDNMCAKRHLRMQRHGTVFNVPCKRQMDIGIIFRPGAWQ